MREGGRGRGKEGGGSEERKGIREGGREVTRRMVAKKEEV